MKQITLEKFKSARKVALGSALLLLVVFICASKIFNPIFVPTTIWQFVIILIALVVIMAIIFLVTFKLETEDYYIFFDPTLIQHEQYEGD